jgi:molecular chaperone GrpE
MIESIDYHIRALARIFFFFQNNSFLHLVFQLHEAIMREESSEFEEGIILQEFRKGFKLGERLLRPAMVKVSAGPGPEKFGDDDPTAVEGSVAPQKVDEVKDDGFGAGDAE